MEYRNELIEAISHGNQEKVKNLLKHSSESINQVVGENSYLYYAVRFKKIQIIKLLLQNGAIITPEIFPSFDKVNKDIIKLLLSYDLDIDAKDFNGATYLHLAVKNNLKDIVEFLIAKGADVNAKTYSKQSVLQLALHEKNEDIIKCLLQSEPSIHSHDDRGETALHSAVNMQNIELTKIIIEKGADLNAIDNFGLTPLHSAVLKNNVELVLLLLEKGSNPNCKTMDKSNPLHLAVSNDCIETARILINKLNINDSTEAGITALHSAVSTGNLEMVNLLIDNHADVNAIGMRDETPLNIAVAYEHEKIAEYLILNGAVVNHGLSQDMLLHMAVFNRNEYLVNLLLDNNADIHVKYKDGKTALHLAVDFKCLKISKLLLKKGIVVNSQTENGNTALHLAVEHKDYEMCSILLQAKADINIENNDRKTPLCTAAEKGYFDIITLFLTYKPDLDTNKFVLHFALSGGQSQYQKIILELLAYGFTLDFIINYNHKEVSDLLKKTVSNGHLGILQRLIKINLNLNKILFDFKNETFKTLIHAAVENNQLEIAKLLLINESDVNTYDERGHKPIFYAVQNGFLDMTKFLLHNNSDISSDHQLFFMVISSGNYEIIQEYLKFYDNVNVEDEFGTTALHFAAWNGDEETVHLLLQKGAKSKNIENLPQVHFNSQIKSTIQDYYGEDVLEEFRKNIVTTALHIAVRKNYSDIVEAFLEHGFNANSRDGCGRTPLHIACLFYNTGVVDVLLEFNADFYAVDLSGYTCADYIFQNDQLIHKYLLDRVFAFIHNVDDIEFTLSHSFKNFFFSKEIFIKYLAIFNSINCIYHENFLNCEKVRKFFRVFKTEVEKLKDQIIWSKVSLYDVLTKRIDTVAFYINNENFLKILESKMEKFTCNVYYKILTQRIRRAKERRFLLDEAELYFGNIICLPDLVINKIVNMLSNKDLKCIKQAYELSLTEVKNCSC